MSGQLSRRELEKLGRMDIIVNIALEIFLLHGYEKTSMDEIARKSEFTKRTIYKYFANKEDLFFAVVRKCFENLFSYFQKMAAPGKNGYEKINAIMHTYYQFYKENPGAFRIMNYVGILKSEKQDVPQYRKFLEFDGRLFSWVMSLIDEGKADGSIRADLDTPRITFSLIFLLTGFLQELMIAGMTYTKHFALDEEEFSISVLKLLSEMIKAHET